jgi:hypothetical protein
LKGGKPMGKKYKVDYEKKGSEENGKELNYVFLLIFFGIVIVIQIVGIMMRNFQASLGQLIGIAIGMIGYAFILTSYLKSKKRKKK